MRKPLAVQRREYMASTGPTLFGMKRLDKCVSPKGQTCLFLGARDGEVYLECEDKAMVDPFIKVDSDEFRQWKKV
jgi:hypothetical protein